MADHVAELAALEKERGYYPNDPDRVAAVEAEIKRIKPLAKAQADAEAGDTEPEPAPVIEDTSTGAPETTSVPRRRRRTS